jgi:hypothetical protein
MLRAIPPYPGAVQDNERTELPLSAETSPDAGDMQYMPC